MNPYHIRQAQLEDVASIMRIVEDAVTLLRNDHVDQWQNNYPNPTVVRQDIENKTMVVAVDGDTVVGFCNISFEEDENYQTIFDGSWVTNNPYIVLHRIAVAKEYYGKGVSKAMLEYSENLARANKITSIRVDTHPDNMPMNRLLLNHGFIRCGMVVLRGVTNADPIRVGYEKILNI